MNVIVTGIGPMMSCAMGAKSLSRFNLDDLWIPKVHEWFDPNVELGGRGFKYFSAATRYLMAAVKQFEQTSEGNTTVSSAAEKGVVIGSNSCTRQTLDEIDRTVLEQGYKSIHPMRAPSFCANIGTGTISIRHQAKAFNITLMNPITAGLEAVILAKQAIMDRRASSVIAGAMEDDAEFTLGRQYPVKTAGGAWALRLEAASSQDSINDVTGASYVEIGATLNRFIPSPVVGNEYNSEPLLQSLGRDFAPMLSGGKNLRVSVAMLTDPHSQFIAGLLLQILARHGVQAAQINVPSKDTTHGTLQALAQLSWSCVNADKAICIAISPLGHVAAVEISRSRATGK